MKSIITIAGIEIGQDPEGRYSLNDLHRAAGGEARHEPNQFTRLDLTQALIAEINSADQRNCIETRRGANGGTFGCRELVYAYAMWISPAFHLKVIRTFDAVVMGTHPFVPQSLPEALRLAADLVEQKAIAEAERDEAIRTKALIGSRREATAMATAAAAKREATRLQHELGHNTRHATIIAVERATNSKFAKNAYVELRRWCKQYGIKPAEVQDPRYGTVKAWPVGAWAAVFGIELADLFGEVAA